MNHIVRTRFRPSHLLTLTILLLVLLLLPGVANTLPATGCSSAPGLPD